MRMRKPACNGRMTGTGRCAAGPATRASRCANRPSTASCARSSRVTAGPRTGSNGCPSPAARRRTASARRPFPLHTGPSPKISASAQTTARPASRAGAAPGSNACAPSWRSAGAPIAVTCRARSAAPKPARACRRIWPSAPCRCAKPGKPRAAPAACRQPSATRPSRPRSTVSSRVSTGTATSSRSWKTRPRWRAATCTPPMTACAHAPKRPTRASKPGSKAARAFLSSTPACVR